MFRLQFETSRRHEAILSSAVVKLGRCVEAGSVFVVFPISTGALPGFQFYQVSANPVNADRTRKAVLIMMSSVDARALNNRIAIHERSQFFFEPNDKLILVSARELRMGVRLTSQMCWVDVEGWN